MKNITPLLVLAMLMAAACSTHNDRIDASGSFEAEETTISAEVAGRLVAFTAREGSTVQQGEQLGLIDTTMLELQRRQLQCQRAALGHRKPDIASQTAATEQQIAAAQRERSRLEQLLAGGAATQKQLDDVESQIATLQKQLASARTSLAASSQGIDGEMGTVEAQIAQVEENLRRCHLAAPMSGTILGTYARPNELVAAGTPLYKIADLETMTLRAYVTSAQLTQIKLGQKATVMADYGDDKRPYSGTVVWISDKSEFTPKTVQTQDERANLVYAIKLRVDNDGYIKIGMSGEVRFE